MLGKELIVPSASIIEREAGLCGSSTGSSIGDGALEAPETPPDSSCSSGSVCSMLEEGSSQPEKF